MYFSNWICWPTLPPGFWAIWQNTNNIPALSLSRTSGSYNIKRVVGLEQILFYKVEEVVAKESQVELQADL